MHPNSPEEISVLVHPSHYTSPDASTCPALRRQVLSKCGPPSLEVTQLSDDASDVRAFSGSSSALTANYDAAAAEVSGDSQSDTPATSTQHFGDPELVTCDWEHHLIYTSMNLSSRHLISQIPQNSRFSGGVISVYNLLNYRFHNLC